MSVLSMSRADRAAKVVIILGVCFTFSVAFAQTEASHSNDSKGDSSADVAGGFDKVIEKSQGVMIRVPINEKGEENTNASELRVYMGSQKVTSSAELEQAWDNSEQHDQIPELSSVDTTKDSSTFGWWRWHGYGWNYPYWYSSYRPAFYWGGNSWNYGSPIWYDNWYWGNRYYYYPSYYYWR